MSGGLDTGVFGPVWKLFGRDVGAYRVDIGGNCEIGRAKRSWLKELYKLGL